MPKPDVKVVILSRRRADTIAKNTLVLMPTATITVEESEVDDYAQVVPREQILPHPKFETMAHLRNWLNETVDAEFLIHVHDDLFQVRCLVGWRGRRYRDPEFVAQLLERTAVCARDAGCYLFGFGNIAGGTPHYDKMRPFKFNGFVRNVIGFRRGHNLRWDPRMMGHYDVDLALQALQQHRIIWRDERWIFDDVRLAANRGGFAGVRTQAGVTEGRANMMDKWGPRYVRFKPRRDRHKGPPSTEASLIMVRRRDSAVTGR